MSFSLAHLSDAHLAGLRKREIFRNFRGKRLLGAYSWFMNRQHHHQLVVANAVRDSILDARIDHVALTGDLVNIAMWNEFSAAATWVSTFGTPDRLSFIPGNHDTYVPVPWEKGLNYLTPWMTPDRQEGSIDEPTFPYVRMRRMVALIGLNSGRPQPYFSAGGTVGEQQLRDLKHVLDLLGQQGFFRIVMIHHPPLPGLAVPRKALSDAAALKQVLIEEGCELVLHGHNHRFMLNWLETKSGSVPIIGAASASSRGNAIHEPGGWNKFHILRKQGNWQVDMTRYVWHETSQKIEPLDTTTLLPP